MYIFLIISEREREREYYFVDLIMWDLYCEKLKVLIKFRLDWIVLWKLKMEVFYVDCKL